MGSSRINMLTIAMPLLFLAAASHGADFCYNGFQTSNLLLDGVAAVTPDGLLQLTRQNTMQQKGHAFYGSPLAFKATPNATVQSFSTNFVFGILSDPPNATLSGHGIAFLISPTINFSTAMANNFLGMFNSSNNGNDTNHIFAVELDTVYNVEFSDIDNNHVGIDINGLRSKISFPAGYIDSEGAFNNLSIAGGTEMHVWVDYDNESKVTNVAMAPFNHLKPNVPLLSYQQDLSPYFLESMYVGFSSSTGIFSTSHYLMGWSFSNDGEAQPLSNIPHLPKTHNKLLTIVLPVILSVFGFVGLTMIIISYLWRRCRFPEVIEEWEQGYGAHRIKYRHLHSGTRGFKEVLGEGVSGKVFKGVLPKSRVKVAVKVILRESSDQMEQFVAEIVSMGQLSHRNLVQLLGYSLRNSELLLVYEFMPNGSLDKYLHDQPKVTLNWDQRMKVIKDVASGLLYLHHNSNETVIHRDIKASNVLLDENFNGRLGDFGLARVYDRENGSQTTRVAGTIGYVAPELLRTCKPTTFSDVYAFGSFLLEVACGRRPIYNQSPHEIVKLKDVVFDLWSRGEIAEARDPTLGIDFAVEEVELVLKLGLMCSNTEPRDRPSIMEVVQYLGGVAPLPQLALQMSVNGITTQHPTLDDGVDSYPFAELYSSASSPNNMYTRSSLDDSNLSQGR